MSIDKEFIYSLEGGPKTEGYVPEHNGQVIGHSGVTVGAGVDLGSKDERYFQNLGIQQATIDKLKPYFGKQGNEAKTYLKSHPLNITEAEARQITEEAMKMKVQSVKTEYNKDIGSGKTKFEDLTVGQRTVICSVLFQYGSKTRVPTFWKHATNQEWKKVEGELRDFKDSFPTRRNKEADRLNH